MFTRFCFTGCALWRMPTPAIGQREFKALKRRLGVAQKRWSMTPFEAENLR